MELIMLTGFPGSGKSTLAEEFKQEGYTVVSSDSVREKLYGDESIQGNPREVFQAAQTMAATALRSGEDVVFDSTALNAKDRASTLNGITELTDGINYSKVSITVDTDIRVAQIFNQERERKVPDYVFINMQKKYQMPTEREGFDEVKTLHIPMSREKIDQMDRWAKEDLLDALYESNQMNSYGETYFSIETGKDFITVINSINHELNKDPDLLKGVDQMEARDILEFNRIAECEVPDEAFHGYEPLDKAVKTELRNIAADIHEISAREIYDSYER